MHVCVSERESGYIVEVDSAHLFPHHAMVVFTEGVLQQTVQVLLQVFLHRTGKKSRILSQQLSIRAQNHSVCWCLSLPKNLQKAQAQEIR